LLDIRTGWLYIARGEARIIYEIYLWNII